MKKAMTLYQPWATLLCMGIKQIDTSEFTSDYRGDILVHASNRITKEAEVLYHNPLFAPYINLFKGPLPVGVIIGQVTITDIMPAHDWCLSQGYADAGRIQKGFTPNFEDFNRENLLGNLGAGQYAWICQNPMLFKEPVPAIGTTSRIWKFRQCRVCGCSEQDPCIVHGSTCHWATQDLCSNCYPDSKAPGPCIRQYQTFVTYNFHNQKSKK